MLLMHKKESNYFYGLQYPTPCKQGLNKLRQVLLASMN